METGEKSLLTVLYTWSNETTAKGRRTRCNEDELFDFGGKPRYTYKVVRREKPKPYGHVKE